MSFTGNEDHSISLKEAAKLTKNYRQSTSTGTLLGGYFSKSALQKILNQENCVGIRIYNARTEAGKPNFVLAGVNSNGDDLTGGELAEFISGCPPFCPEASELAGTA